MKYSTCRLEHPSDSHRIHLATKPKSTSNRRIICKQKQFIAVGKNRAQSGCTPVRSPHVSGNAAKTSTAPTKASKMARRRKGQHSACTNMRRYSKGQNGGSKYLANYRTSLPLSCFGGGGLLGWSAGVGMVEAMLKNHKRLQIHRFLVTSNERNCLSVLLQKLSRS